MKDTRDMYAFMLYAPARSGATGDRLLRHHPEAFMFIMFTSKRGLS